MLDLQSLVDIADKLGLIQAVKNKLLRQPNAAADIRVSMIVAAGLIEGATFFSLIVTILLANK